MASAPCAGAGTRSVTLDREATGRGAAEPVEPGLGEDDRVVLAGGHPGDPLVDVAADGRHPQVGAHAMHPRRPPHRAGADDRAGGQRLRAGIAR